MRTPKERGSGLCATKYPIVLVHGIGFRDRKLHNYWGRIPRTLQKNGAAVFYGGQDAWGSVERNAHILKKRVEDVLAQTGCDKVNIIAHSKGGLEARYVISRLGMGECVASLTTISTPHYGSKTMEFIFYFFPQPLLKFAAVFVNLYFWLLGDIKPDFYRTCRQLTASYCKKFNRAVPDCKNVYYQSYATAMKKPYSDMLLMLTHLIIKLFDGENDGMVGAASAVWGDYKGIITNAGIRGVSHIDAVDGRRMKVGGLDMRDVYAGIVEGLKGKGF
jgi:triacylglycerol lipase